MKKTIALFFVLNITSLYVCGAEVAPDSHEDSNGYTCPFTNCSHRPFVLYRTLREHVSSEHKRALPYQADLTDDDYHAITGRRRPQTKAKEGNTTFKCPALNCARTFTRFSSLKNHANSAHNMALPSQNQLSMQDPDTYHYIRGSSSDKPLSSSQFIFSASQPFSTAALQSTLTADADVEMKDTGAQGSSSSSSVSPSPSSDPSSALMNFALAPFLPDKPFICPISTCGNIFDSFEELNKHARNTHNYTLQSQPPQ